MEKVETSSGAAIPPRPVWRVADERAKPFGEGRRCVLLLIVFLFLGWGCGDNVSSLNRQALKNMQAGELPAAEALLLEALRLASDQPVLYANLAEVYCRQGRFDEARRYQAQCVGLQNGKNPDQNRRLAEILLRTRQTEKAVAELADLRDRNPEDPEVAYALCVAQLRAGDGEDVSSLLQECRRKFPGEPLFRFLEARLALRRQDTEKARSILDEALKNYPDSPEANLLLGDLHFTAGEFAQAAERYEKVLVRRDGPEILLKLGKIRSRLGEADEAEKHLRKVVGGEYESEALLELAALYIRNPGGQWSKNQALSNALESCDRALVADPLNVRARNLKAKAYAERHQLGPMLNELNKSLSIDPDQPDVQALVDAYQSTESP